MTATTTRTRTTTAPAQSRRRMAQRYDAHIDGANALQIGYADPVVEEPYAPPAPDSAPAAPTVGAARPQPVPLALPRTSFLVAVVAVVVAAVLGVLVLNTKINENSFTLDNLRSQQSALDVQEQQLSQQLADLESTGNLSAQAARLGLVPAGSPAFLTLPNGRIVGVPQPAEGAPPRGGTAPAGDPGR